MENHCLNVADVAALLGVGKSSIYNLVKSGSLNHYQVGRKIRFTRKDVEDYVRNSHAKCRKGVRVSTSLDYPEFSEGQKDRIGFIICGQDLILDILSNYMRHSGVHALRAYIGSYDSLIALYRNKIHVASSHLWDASDDSYNTSYVTSLLPGVSCAIFHLACRIQGFYVAKGNPKSICSWEDFRRPDITMINREKGAGSRVLLDQNLKLLGIGPESIRGYENENQSHLAVASAVGRGEVDIAVGTEKIAQQVENIDFYPMKKESYDLVVKSASLHSPEVELMLDIIRSARFQREFVGIGGYDLSDAGKMIART